MFGVRAPHASYSLSFAIVEGVSIEIRIRHAESKILYTKLGKLYFARCQ